jgi:hypothetical protein
MQKDSTTKKDTDSEKANKIPLSDLRDILVIAGIFLSQIMH